MQEVFEKIRERLKNELHLAQEDCERYLNGNTNQFLYARARGYEVAMENAIEIVDQVAEEYVPDINVGSKDVCKWKPDEFTIRGWKTSCNPKHSINAMNVSSFKYCPYCGRKIKVVSND